MAITACSGEGLRSGPEGETTKPRATGGEDFQRYADAALGGCNVEGVFQGAPHLPGRSVILVAISLLANPPSWVAHLPGFD
jgi:hypothetical protein